MTAPTEWPSRAEIEARWLAILDGSTTREEVHDWTVPWVEGDGPDSPPDEGLVVTGLQMLHGFTMAYDPATPNLIHYGPPGVYVRSLDDIRADYEYWLRNCDEYDADPAAYRARRLAVAESYVAAERQRRASRRGSDAQD